MKTDVLVVGGGPAGSMTAKYAAMAGANVTVLERRSQIGVPVRCGEFLPCLEEIKAMFPNAEDLEETFSFPSNLKLRHTKGIKLVDPKGKETILELEGFTTDRDRFDQHLADEAKKAGAEYIMNCAYEGLCDGKAVTSQGEIEFKIIVGADGPGSRVARNLGLEKNHRPYPAVTAQAKGDFGDYVVMFFGGIAPGAYSWIIPKKDQANVGVGFSPKFANAKVGDYFDIFVKKNNFEIMNKLEGKYVPSEGPIPKTVAENGMVVGDAAGHVVSVNGGGIPLSLIAGKICGTVAAGVVQGKASVNDYEKSWRYVMYKPLKTAAFNKKLADIFAFSGAEWRTTFCMGVLGKRRMGNLIRCKKIFP